MIVDATLTDTGAHGRVHYHSLRRAARRAGRRGGSTPGGGEPVDPDRDGGWTLTANELDAVVRSRNSSRPQSGCTPRVTLRLHCACRCTAQCLRRNSHSCHSPGTAHSGFRWHDSRRPSPRRSRTRCSRSDGLVIATLGAAVVLADPVSSCEGILTMEASMRLPPRLRSKKKCRPVGSRLPLRSSASHSDARPGAQPPQSCGPAAVTSRR